MKQALTEALEADNRNFLVHTDYDGSWEFSDDAELIFAAARLVERLLPGVCENCGGTGSTFDDPNCYACTCPVCHGSGQVWDEGIVEAVADAMVNQPTKALAIEEAHAVLSAIAELLTEKVET